LLYVTSHDLREPLRAIENFSRIVNDRYSERLDDKGQDSCGASFQERSG
jgi:light-regulated signal transduction histidine kinase (bacteriophytochrome)